MIKLSNSKTKKLVLTLSPVILLLVVLGFSYAYWQIVSTQEDDNNISTLNCLNISFIDGDAISLTNEYPILSSEGMAKIPYIFTITNTCLTTYVASEITLEILNSASPLRAEYVRVSLQDNGIAVDNSGILNAYAATVPMVGEASYVLDNIPLGPEESKTYDLRMWLDADATYTETANKTFLSKVVIKSTPMRTYEAYTNGHIVYFNPETGLKCNDYIETNSNNEHKTGCLKWYVFNDGVTSATVNLLLDHNTTKCSRWSSTSTNETNGDTAKTKLLSDVAAWTTDVKATARLITIGEVAKITAYTDWDFSFPGSQIYLETNSMLPSPTCTSGNVSGCQYGWLYDRTGTNCVLEWACLNNSNTMLHSDGYWTASASTHDLGYAWEISRNYISPANVDDGSSGGGIRPVITIEKSILR